MSREKAGDRFAICLCCTRVGNRNNRLRHHRSAGCFHTVMTHCNSRNVWEVPSCLGPRRHGNAANPFEAHDLPFATQPASLTFAGDVTKRALAAAQMLINEYLHDIELGGHRPYPCTLDPIDTGDERLIMVRKCHASEAYPLQRVLFEFMVPGDAPSVLKQALLSEPYVIGNQWVTRATRARECSALFGLNREASSARTPP